MKDDDTTELTLPSVVSSLRSPYLREQLVLTVIFHSDPARIGEVALLSFSGADASAVLGRAQPLFRSPQTATATRPLADPYVSRVAVELAWNGGLLVLGRGRSASRCQVAGRELTADVGLDPEQLRQGVSILLGHSVVLLLRLGESPVADPSYSAASAGLIGSSASSQYVRDLIAQAAATDVDVLIRGETGTGKDLVARAIHAASRRGGGALVAVNMSAVPAGLAPAVLFGSARGAFTGADKAQIGYFQQAEGGTLFLDEVGDTPRDIQPQLLRALQEGEIQVVGGAIRQVDVRIISATDAPLQGPGTDFKAALRHRLCAFDIPLSPLRERPEDVGELLWHYLGAELKAAGLSHLLPADNTPAQAIARWADLFHKCLRYSWPGNVRELVNWARQVALGSGEHLILPANLYAALEADSSDGEQQNAAGASLRRMEQVDEEEFIDAWQVEEYEVASIARRLRVSRQAVYRRIRATDGMRTAGEVPADELKALLIACDGDLRQVALQLCVSFSGLRARAQQLAIWPLAPGS